MFQACGPLPRSLHTGPPALPTPVHLGCINESPGTEQAKSMLVAVAEACLIGGPIRMVVLILTTEALVSLLDSQEPQQAHSGHPLPPGLLADPGQALPQTPLGMDSPREAGTQGQAPCRHYSGLLLQREPGVPAPERGSPDRALPCR